MNAAPDPRSPLKAGDRQGNQPARAAAMTSADNPGDPAYNPLFVIGAGLANPLGAGDSARVREKPQGAHPLLHAEAVMLADIMRAYPHKAFRPIKRYYHSLDLLLLIDDIQFFVGKQPHHGDVSTPSMRSSRAASR